MTTEQDTFRKLKQLTLHELLIDMQANISGDSISRNMWNLFLKDEDYILACKEKSYRHRYWIMIYAEVSEFLINRNWTIGEFINIDIIESYIISEREVPQFKKLQKLLESAPNLPQYNFVTQSWR